MNISASKMNNTILILFILSLTLFISSLYKRVITLDDAYFAEQAYWVNKAGYSKTELFSGVLDWGNRQYVYHKLHVWQTAMIAKLTGWSPYYMKAAPIAYLLIFIVFSYRYFKQYISADINAYYLFLTLLLINTYVVQFGFETRPEMMMMCVAFLSYISIRHGVNTNDYRYIVLSGALAGCAALFHLNGLIFIFSGFCLLLYTRNYKLVAIFTVSAVAVTSIYLYEIIANDALSIAMNQLANDPALRKDSLNFNSILNKILASPKRFFRHLFDASYTLLFITILYLNRHNFKNHLESRLLLIYFITAEIMLAIISAGGKSMYLILHMPYALIIIALYSSNFNNYTEKTRSLLIILFTFYFITQAGHTLAMIKKRNSDIIDTHASIIKKYNIHKNDNIIAPALFVFNEIDNAKITASELFKVISYSGQLIFSDKNIFDYSKTHQYKYLIFKRDFLPDMRVNTLLVGQEYFGYRLTGIEPYYFVFSIQ